MQVRFSDEAVLDLEEIGDFIALDNPSRAVSYIIELREACISLAENPFRFASLNGFEHLHYRRRVYGQYLIVYLVAAELILIVRIVSGAVDLSNVLRDD